MVVLYNPDQTVSGNIRTYHPYIDRLYAADNSDRPDETILSAIRKIEDSIYIPLNGNHGIGAALNLAARMAIASGYQWLLTMDQDTRVSGNIIAMMARGLRQYRKHEIGMIACRYTHRDLYVEKKGPHFNELLVTITSGSLLNLQAYQKTGPFMEKLFIDQVDHEYCMRLKKNHYKVIQANDAVLDHHMGNKKKHAIGYCPHYNPVRRYFITRNRFFVAWMYRKEFPRFYRYEMFSFIKELAGILIYENDKYSKLRNIVLGFIDFKNNNFGRNLNELREKAKANNL